MIGEMFLTAKMRPLTEEEFSLLVPLMISEQKNENIIPPVAKKMLQYQVIEKRLTAYNIKDKIDDRVILFCTLISKNLAEVVMWSYTLALILTKQKKHLTISDWCQWFPVGIPTEEEKHRCWLEQKKEMDESHSDNKIDDFTNWPVVNRE
jgi:hypothetical protein